MLREKSIVTIAILLMGMMLYGQAKQRTRMPDDAWHRNGATAEGCPTCHEMGPVMDRS